MLPAPSAAPQDDDDDTPQVDAVVDMALVPLIDDARVTPTASANDADFGSSERRQFLPQQNVAAVGQVIGLGQPLPLPNQHVGNSAFPTMFEHTPAFAEPKITAPTAQLARTISAYAAMRDR